MAVIAYTILNNKKKKAAGRANTRLRPVCVPAVETVKSINCAVVEGRRTLLGKDLGVEEKK